MTFYFKIINEEGKVISLLTCDMHLYSSETQIEISEEEYNTLMAEIIANRPEPEENNLEEVIDILTGEVE